MEDLATLSKQESKERKEELISSIMALATDKTAIKNQEHLLHAILGNMINLELQRMKSHISAGDEVQNAKQNSDDALMLEELHKSEEADAQKHYAEELREFCDQFNSSKSEIAVKTEQIIHLQSQINTAKELAKSKNQDITNSRRHVVLKSKYQKTGKQFDPAVYEKFETTEANQLEQLITLMTRCNLFKKRIELLSNRIREREKKNQGLNMGEFEQLKIETQSLKEKIEDRLVEMDKLSQKKTNLVHAITHIQVKLEAVKHLNEDVRQEQTKAHSEVKTYREIVPILKKRREQMRKEVADLKAQSGLLIYKNLLHDFEIKQVEYQKLAQEVNSIKSRYHELLDSKKADEMKLKQIMKKSNQSGNSDLLNDLAEKLMITRIGIREGK